MVVTVLAMWSHLTFKGKEFSNRNMYLNKKRTFDEFILHVSLPLCSTKYVSINNQCICELKYHNLYHKYI